MLNYKNAIATHLALNPSIPQNKIPCLNDDGTRTYARGDLWKIVAAYLEEPGRDNAPRFEQTAELYRRTTAKLTTIDKAIREVRRLTREVLRTQGGMDPDATQKVLK